MNFRQQVRVMVDRELSPEAQSARLVAAARGVLADLVQSGRAPDVHTTRVDGRPATTEDGATRNVTYDFAFIGDAAAFALDFLRIYAPVDTGAYRDGFIAAVNGRQIPARQFVARSVPAGAEVLIYNPLPYSRKIDVQLSGTRRLKYSTPPGMFDAAARAVRSRFGNSVKAERLYTVRFPGQWTIRRGADQGRIVDSPALSIRSVE